MGQPCLSHCVIRISRALRLRMYRVHETNYQYSTKTHTLMTGKYDELEKAGLHGLVGSIRPSSQELQKLRSKIDAVQINVDRKAQIHEILQQELRQGRDDYVLFQVQALKGEAEQADTEDREKQKHRINALKYRQELEKQIQERERLRHDAIVQAHAIENLLALEQMRKFDTKNDVAKNEDLQQKKRMLKEMKTAIEQGGKVGDVAADP
jgi:hypothetical protein